MANTEIATIRAYLDGLPPAAELTIQQHRDFYDRAVEAYPVDDTVTVTETRVGTIPTDHLTFDGMETANTLLYLHGGGYVIGSRHSHRHLAAALGQAAGAEVVVPDYRLAPEHPFPAAIDDATAVYRALLDQGHDPSNLAIAGDSAGGGLTLATLLALRDADLPLPASAACLSPWTDLAATGDSITSRAERDPLVDAANLKDWAALYLDGKPADTPLASPLYADLAGLPPILIHVGDDEILLDDALGLHKAARAADTQATVEVWTDMIHVWHWFHPRLKEGRDAIADIGRYLRRHWD